MSKEHHGGQVVRLNLEEVKFDRQVMAWLEGDITYDQLMDSYPSHRLSVPKRAVRSVKQLFKSRA